MFLCKILAFTCERDGAEACDCVRCSQALMAPLIPSVIDSPHVFSLVLPSRERVPSNQEVNYLELIASHSKQISQQALLMPIDWFLLSVSLAASVSPRRCTRSMAMLCSFYSPVGAPSWGFTDNVFGHIDTTFLDNNTL